MVTDKKKLVLFSGLGADERVFKYLDLSNYDLKFIQWKTPLKGETITQYAKRLTEQITSERPILIGLSFGGIIAVEVGKLIATEKIILISSAKVVLEIPFYYRISGKLKLHKLLPAQLFLNPNKLTYWIFGTSGSQERTTLTAILKNTDPVFLKWAIDQVLNWNNKVTLQNIYHIHGSEDRILPARFITNPVIIEGGGHWAVVNRAKEIGKFIKDFVE